MKQALAIFLLVALTFLWVADSARNPGLSSPITESDLSHIKSVITSQLEKDSSNIHTAFYASSALQTETPKQADLINLAKSILSKKETQSVETIHHALGVVENLKADNVVVDQAVVDSIRNTIEEIESSLVDFYHAGMAGLSLRAIKQQKDLKDEELATLVGKVAELAEEDGSFKNFLSDKEGSLYNAGLGLQLIGRLAKELKLSVEDTEHVTSVVEKAESLVGLGNEEDGSLEFTSADDSISSLAATSSVLRGLDAIAATQKKIDIKPVDIAQIAQYLVNHRGVGSAADGYHLLTALRVAQSNTIGIPLAVSLERASIVGTAKGAEGHVRVKVTDVLDQPVSVSKVYLTKAHPVGRDSHVLINNQELTLTDDKKAYSLNFLAAKPDQGFYALEFRVPGQGKYATIDAAVRQAKVVGSISITDLEIVVADSKEATSKASEGSRYKAADQTKKVEDVVRIDHLQFVQVQFRVRNAATNKAVLVQQAFVKFVHSSGFEHTFVAQANDNKVYSLLINVEEAAKKDLRSHSGDYKIEIVVGDAFIQNPVHWVAAPKVKLNLLTSASASTSAALGALPEIKHRFRTPESRPATAVSSAFTLLVFSPLALLFIGFIMLGANISNFPFGGVDFLYAVGFIGSIGATLALMGLFWVQLNLVQTLGYLAALSIPSVFFGQRALSYLSRRKEKSE